MRRILIGVGVVLAFLAGTITPSSAEVSAQKRVCVGTGGNHIQWFDGFNCVNGYLWTPVVSSATCYDINQFTDPLRPAPNGWGNLISSVRNITDHELRFYDTRNCTGAILFGMQPRTMRATLAAAANNKSSSVLVIRRI